MKELIEKYISNQGNTFRYFELSKVFGLELSEIFEYLELDCKISDNGEFFELFRKDGKIIYYEHDSGDFRHALYNGAGHLISKSDNHGKNYKISYNPFGLISKITHDGGFTMEVFYDSELTEPIYGITRPKFRSVGSRATEKLLEQEWGELIFTQIMLIKPLEKKDIKLINYGNKD